MKYWRPLVEVTEPPPPLSAPQHPARNPREEDGRDDHRQQEMLGHVGAEEIVVTQVVQWRVQRYEQQDNGEPEPEDVA